MTVAFDAEHDLTVPAAATSMQAEMIAEVLDFYTNRCDENARLSSTIRGRLEAIRIREIVERHLPNPASRSAWSAEAGPVRIADVGGGPGVHALWFTAAGYRVDLLDPIPRHIDTARRAGVKSATLGDARHLPFGDTTYDLVLLAGPLYHLPPEDRARALSEAYRVTVPGGVVAAVAVNRYANLIGAAVANQLDRRRPIVNDILATGYSPSNDRVPHMYYHSPSELAAEFATAGLRHVDIYGLTGPGGWLTVALDRHFLETGLPLPSTLKQPDSPDPLETALSAARYADAYPDLTASSAQLIAVGYRGWR